MNTEILLYISWTIMVTIAIALSCGFFLFQFRKVRRDIRLALNEVNNYTYKTMKFIAPDTPSPAQVVVKKSNQKAKVYKPSEDFDKNLKEGKEDPFFD